MSTFSTIETTTTNFGARATARHRTSQSPAYLRPVTPQAMPNVRMMHLLEWIVGKFNEAGIPIMVLKGGALFLTLYQRPDEREMTDLDVLLKPIDLDRAQKLLEDLGCHRGEVLFREDFFPRYYYEVQYRIGSISPFNIDLHVRPFRLLRYSRLVPEDALWQRAVPVKLGNATVLVPSAEDMLIQMAVHSAIHSNDLKKWLEDIDGWIRAHGPALDWDRFLNTVESWRLAGAVQSGIEAAQRLLGPACPAHVLTRLRSMPRNWRDRLALWHAPRDGKHMMASFLVNALTTPGLGFVLGYLREVFLPNRTYLGEWSIRHRCPWPGAAIVLRYFWPVVERMPWIGRWITKVEVRSSYVHGLGVFATRDIEQGDVIARYRGRTVDRDGIYVSCHTDASGNERRHEITGPLKYLNHSCRPNAVLGGFRLKALVAIRAGQEITMSYGDDACDCDRAPVEGRGVENGIWQSTGRTTSHPPARFPRPGGEKGGLCGPRRPGPESGHSGQRRCFRLRRDRVSVCDRLGLLRRLHLCGCIYHDAVRRYARLHVRMNMARLRLVFVVVLCLAGFRLEALVAIRAGQKITMSYGEDACDCDRDARQMERS